MATRFTRQALYDLVWSKPKTTLAAGLGLSDVGLGKICREAHIYLLSAVLHGFDDEACITILRNVAKACGQTGARIALLEMVLPEVGADVAAASFDMQMFMGSWPAGK